MSGIPKDPSPNPKRRSREVERFSSQGHPFEDNPVFSVLPVQMPLDPFAENPRVLWGAMVELEYPDGRKRSWPVEFDSGLVLDTTPTTAIRAGHKRIDALMGELEDL